MSVNGVSNQYSPKANEGNVATNDSSAAGMNNLFLQLLVAQIQNQDPLNPTGGTEYVNQMAQVAQVTSMENMTRLMANNGVLMDNLQTLSTGSLVGQEVMVQSDTVESDGITNIKGRLTLSHAANSVTVIVKDESGNETKIDLGKHEKGEVDFNIDPEGLGLKEGQYSLSVVTDTEEEDVPIEVGGVVKNVRIPLDGSPTVLNIAGLGEVAYNNITQFGQSNSHKINRLMS